MGLKETQYVDIRRRLDSHGYNQPFTVDSALLIEKLLCDVGLLKNQLARSKEAAEHAIIKSNSVDQQLARYKSENEQLIRENNRLHIVMINEKDDASKTIRELKSQLMEVENSYSDLEFIYMEQMANVGELHQDILLKNKKIFKLSSPKAFYSSNSKNDRAPPLSKVKKMHSDYQIKKPTMMGKSIDEALAREIESLRKEKVRLLDSIELGKCQVEVRDGEIERLGRLLEKKSFSCPDNQNYDCRCFFHNDLTLNEPSRIEEKLKDAQKKQHEAMKRATDLLERVSILEDKLSATGKKDTYCLCYCNNQSSVCDINEVNLKQLEATKNSFHVTETEELKKEISNLESKLSSLLIENLELKNKQANFNDISVGFKRNDESQTHGNERNPLVLSDTCCACCHRQCDCCSNNNSGVFSKFEEANSTSPTICSHKNVIRVLKNTQKESEDEINSLRNELTALKEKLSGLSHEKHNEKCNSEVVKLHLEDQMKSCELEKKNVSSKLHLLKEKLTDAEQRLEKMEKSCEELTTECANWRAKYNHIKVLNEHLEMTLRNLEETDKNKETDIQSSISKVVTLEREKVSLENAMSAMHKEKATLRGHVHQLDKEKDEFLSKLDEKTVLVSKLENSIKQKTKYIGSLEQQIANLQAQLQTLEKMLNSTEDKARSSNTDMRKLEADLCALESCKESLLYENRRLQSDIAALANDNAQLSAALTTSRQEEENLKSRLKSYVEEVRRVDQLLQIKENEREQLLEQFRALSAEACNLESNNQSLEFESTNVKKNLQHSQEKINSLEWEVENKNYAVHEFQSQVTDLTSQIADLQSTVSEKNNNETVLSSDLDAARILCTDLESQKQFLHDQIWKFQQNEILMAQELDKLKEENQHLEHKIAEEQQNKYILEDVVTSSRHETIEKSLYNRDLKSEVDAMKNHVQVLESKLEHITHALNDCQQSCSSYRSENVQLKRELTNERYERAKAEESVSFSTSL